MSQTNSYRGWVLNWCSSHFYKNSAWDEKKNQEVFGLCANEKGHGHNYKLEVIFKSESSDIVRIKATLNRLKEKFDHKNLNDLPEFQALIPTTENIANWILHHLKAETGVTSLRLKLWETDLIWVDLRSD